MKNWFRAATALATSAALWVQPALAQTGAPTIDPPTGGDINMIIAAIQNVINWMLMIAGILAVAYLVWAGIQYITGGTKGAEAAKTQIINAVTGIIIIVLSYVIVNTVINLMG